MTERRNDAKTDRDVCVVTQPARRETGKNHTYTLLEILSAVTNVSVITANLSPESPIRDEFEVVEVTDKGSGDSVLTSMIRFAINQIKMCSEIRRRDEDIILFFGATSYLLPILFTRIAGKKAVLEPRGDVPLSLKLRWEDQIPDSAAYILSGCVKTLEHLGYTFSNAVITYTPSMAQQLDLDRYHHKLHPWGARYVDTRKFSVEKPYRKRDNVVGFVGRIDAEKGIDKLSEVAKELPDDIKFRFVGDGDYREKLENKLSTEIKNGKVEMTGWVNHDNVPTELNNLKLHILTSSPTEGLPTIILESFACGTPVYATPVSGVPDVVKENETGYLMHDTDVDTVVDRITEAFRNQELDKMSEKCRKKIEENYSYPEAVERYRKILRSL